MDLSSKEPKIQEVINAVSTLQLERDDWDSVKIVADNMKIWTKQLSSPHRTVSPYFVQVNFESLANKEWELLKKLPFKVMKIPTNFSLSDAQVDSLIAAGRKLLHENPVYQQLLVDLEAP